MPSTLRESTALRGGENHSDSAGLITIPAMGFGPHHSTSVDAILQGLNHLRLSVREPTNSRVAVAVDTALALHTRPGSTGSTVSVIDGNMAGRQLYAVSIDPERTIELETPPSWRQLFAYALTNLDTLMKPGRALGTWINPKGRHVLDVVVCCPIRAVAIAHAQRFRQFSIFDLATSREIQLGRPSRQSSLRNDRGER